MAKAEQTITKEDLVRLRDKEQNSWAVVASTLGLGSPGAARRAYSSLVRPHTESTLAGRPQGEGKVQPVQLAGANLAAVQKAITKKIIVVQRAKGTEDITVAKVTSVKGDTVNFNDGAKSRSVKLEAIIATK